MLNRGENSALSGQCKPVLYEDMLLRKKRACNYLKCICVG